ncbi:Pathogenic type III effector avirulence factor Avr AvrRpt-cleavage: cleavage site protein [Quillaja saponaria]|uniref:Pathogenic type III effector avirulence factor Avr AvrRpt-cleavage: cleavage site protein n=1 Tax=Quillaja saponaria TaxID=32244 RepID=A0AAD7VFF7_QUISA|nr:Pathogenic type III effector avirulence factor Avr AvrRpt-cleavage: cleavage site protein [Quillaja saponaria]
MGDYKRSCQIPAFGNWDYANNLPITQYFECARQAGLGMVRYSCSSGESGPNPNDLYAVDFKKPARIVAPSITTRGREKRCRPPHPNTKKQGKVCDGDMTEPRRKPIKKLINLRPDQYDTRPRLPRPPKPVDEDLYTIPPELHQDSKQVPGTCGLCKSMTIVDQKRHRISPYPTRVRGYLISSPKQVEGKNGPNKWASM